MELAEKKGLGHWSKTWKIAVSLGFQRFITGLPLVYHWDYRGLSLVYHWDYRGLSLVYHWFITDFGLWLVYHWDYRGLSLVYHCCWFIIGLSLVYHWFVCIAGRTNEHKYIPERERVPCCFYLCSKWYVRASYSFRGSGIFGQGMVDKIWYEFLF